MREEFIDEIEIDEKDINDEIFGKYFKHRCPSFLAKDLFKSKNKKLVNSIDKSLIDLRNAYIIGAVPENENPKKITNIVEKIIDLNKQQKGKAIKILTP